MGGRRTRNGASGLPGRVSRLPRNGRSAALQALLLVDSGLNVQQAVAAVLAPPATAQAVPALPPQERNLCAELVYGYLRAELRIAAILDAVLPRPGSLPRPMILLLGLAVYALQFQERVPDHAAVHSAVDAVRRLYGQGLARVANGALRSVQRRNDEFQHIEFYKKRCNSREIDALALFYAVPSWLAHCWEAAFGRATAVSLLRRSFMRPWSALRINARHPAASLLLASLRAQGGEGVGDYGVVFPPGGMPQHIGGREISAWQREGALSLQAAGSQAVLEALGLFAWDAPVWDVCAGFGGKTLALLERDVPVRLAVDRSPARLRLLPGECRRLRLTQPATVIADGMRPPLSRWDGHILVDAPCSGLGVLARRPDIRRRPEEALAQHAAAQRALLSACAALLRPGRQLAYVTCTLRPEENEGAVAALLQQQPALRLLRRWRTPHDHPWLEGMYGALLQKTPC